MAVRGQVRGVVEQLARGAPGAAELDVAGRRVQPREGADELVALGVLGVLLLGRRAVTAWLVRRTRR